MKHLILSIVASCSSLLMLDSATAGMILYSKALADTLSVPDDIDEGTTSAFAQVAGGSVFSSVVTDFGINKAIASASAANSVAQGTSRWLDTLLITSNNPADVGLTFSATFNYHLGGTMGVNVGSSIVSFDFAYDPNDDTAIGEQSTSEFIRHQTPGTLDIDIDGSLTFDFVVGEWFEFQGELFVDASNDISPGIAFTDFFSTAIVTGFTLPDGFTLSSESGTNYQDLQVAQVPEPTSLIVWSLLGCVGLTVGWRHHRRR